MLTVAGENLDPARLANYVLRDSRTPGRTVTRYLHAHSCYSHAGTVVQATADDLEAVRAITALVTVVLVINPDNAVASRSKLELLGDSTFAGL